MLVAALARRLSGTWWAGSVAAALVFLVSALSPYQWSRAAFFDLSLLESNMWTSPTQTFAALLFAAAVLVVACRLRGEWSGVRPWILAALLLAAVMGAKATFLPLLLAGLGVAVLGSLQRERMVRPSFLRGWRFASAAWPALAVGGLAAVYFAFASVVLFGSGSHALQLSPLQTVRVEGVMLRTGLSVGYRTRPGITSTVMIAALTLLAWGARSIAMFGNRASRRDPAIQLLVGISVAGAGLTMALRHPGISQTYFLRSAGPYLGVLSACGLAAVIPAERRTRAFAAVVALAGVAGGALAWAVVHAGPAEPPRGPARAVLPALGAPFMLVAAVLALVAAALLVARTRVSWLRGVTAALLLAAITGTGLAPLAERLARTVHSSHWMSPGVTMLHAGERDIPAGGIPAARWLRAHSRPDQVVATNTHCRKVTHGTCDNRHFWIAGFTERRVLVESWGYTRPVYDEAWAGRGAFFLLPYWDRRRLAENDGLFRNPSKSAADLLRDKYGVRWLLVDRRYDPPSPKLADVAAPRYTSGDTEVYELTGP
jgi:hypothetical protein